jgi:CRP-like cAMP-binding protein
MSTPIDQLYIFEGFSQSEVAYFLLMTQMQTKKKWEIVIREGDPSNGCAYYVSSGHVKITKGENEIAVLGPGAFFGEIALITDERRTATVEAIDDVELQVFLKEDFFILLKRSEHSKDLKETIMKRIQENVKH